MARGGDGMYGDIVSAVMLARPGFAKASPVSGKLMLSALSLNNSGTRRAKLKHEETYRIQSSEYGIVATHFRDI